MTAKAEVTGGERLQQPVVLDGLFIRVDNAENSAPGRNEPRSVHQRPDRRDAMGCLTKRTGTFKRAETESARHRRDLVRDRLRLALALRQPRRAVQSDASPNQSRRWSLNRSTNGHRGARERTGFHDEHLRGDVIIFDFMAHDCPTATRFRPISRLKCRVGRTSRPQRRGLHVIAYGAWYNEDLAYLNTTAALHRAAYRPVLALPTRPS